DPALRGAVEEEAGSDRALDRGLDLGADGFGDPPEPADPRRHAVDRLEIVADRLLARDVRKRAEDGAEEAGRLLAVAAEADALHARLGIDVDEAPVDLAPRRPLLQRRHRRTEGRIVQHRSVD